MLLDKDLFVKYCTILLNLAFFVNIENEKSLTAIKETHDTGFPVDKAGL